MGATLRLILLIEVLGRVKSTGEYGTVSPDYQVVPQGRAIMVNCNSKGIKKWFKNKRRVNVAHLKGNNLYIDRAFPAHSGDYVCEGQFANNEKFTAKATVIVAGKCGVFKRDISLY